MELPYLAPKRTSEGEDFIIEFVILGRSVRVPCKCYNLESASKMALIVASNNYPQIEGYNILSTDNVLLQEVRPSALFVQVAPVLSKLTGTTGFKGAVAAVGTVKPETMEAMVRDARERNRMLIDPTAPPG